MSSTTAISREPLPGGEPAESSYQTRVRDIMTLVVVAVPSEAPARRVVADSVGLKVHRMFVEDAGGALVRVISALGVLHHLR
jgi:CBS domain-containing protein